MNASRRTLGRLASCETTPPVPTVRADFPHTADDKTATPLRLYSLFIGSASTAFFLSSLLMLPFQSPSLVPFWITSLPSSVRPIGLLTLSFEPQCIPSKGDLPSALPSKVISLFIGTMALQTPLPSSPLPCLLSSSENTACPCGTIRVSHVHSYTFETCCAFESRRCSHWLLSLLFCSTCECLPSTTDTVSAIVMYRYFGTKVAST